MRELARRSPSSMFETYETGFIWASVPVHYQRLTAVRLSETGDDRHLEYRRSMATFEPFRQVPPHRQRSRICYDYKPVTFHSSLESDLVTKSRTVVAAAMNFQLQKRTISLEPFDRIQPL